MKNHAAMNYFIWPNKYLLNFMGCWPLESHVSNNTRLFSHMRFIIFIFMTSTLVVSEIFTLSKYWRDITILTEAGCVAIEAGLLLFKLLYMVVRRSRFYQIYAGIKDVWSITISKEDNRSLEDLARIARKITIVFSSTLIFTGASFVFSSIIIMVNDYFLAQSRSYTRKLPLKIWYGTDLQRSPHYEIAFYFQTVGIILGSFAVTGFDSTMMVVVLHICGKLRVIRIRFQTVGNKILKNMCIYSHRITLEKELSQCIEDHRRALMLAKLTKELLSPVIFVQLMSSAIHICLSGYIVMTSEEYIHGDTIKSLFYVLAITMELIIYCWPGQLLIQDSIAVGESIFYDVPWYLFTTAQRRTLSFTIFRTQNQCQLTALSFQVMSLKKLTDVLKTAGSYFTLLRKFHNE